MAHDDRPAADAPGVSGTAGVRDVPPTPVRVAGALVGLQALAAAVFTVALVVLADATGLGLGPTLGEAGFFLLVAVALGAVAAGLLTGRRWARTPAIVTQLLLLPVVYSLLGPSRQVLLGLATGAFVFATLMLLLNERSRLWAMGVDAEADAEAR